MKNNAVLVLIKKKIYEQIYLFIYFWMKGHKNSIWMV